MCINGSYWTNDCEVVMCVWQKLQGMCNGTATHDVSSAR